MIRIRTLQVIVIGVSVLAASAPVRAMPNDDVLYPWFAKATMSGTSATATKLAKPDFIMEPGATHYICSHFASTMKFGRGVAFQTYELLAYDRAHGIALALATTDSCNVGLFKATPPKVHVGDADLSGYHTVRGLRIGSTRSDVIAAYGGSAPKQSGRYVLDYGATVPDVTVSLPHKPVQLPQRIYIVLDSNRVTSILITIEESGLF